VKPKAQRNFTDPDAQIMKTADGSFHFCYNAQGVVDEANPAIVATDFAEMLGHSDRRQHRDRPRGDARRRRLLTGVTPSDLSFLHQTQALRKGELLTPSNTLAREIPADRHRQTVDLPRGAGPCKER